MTLNSEKTIFNSIKDIGNYPYSHIQYSSSLDLLIDMADTTGMDIELFENNVQAHRDTAIPNERVLGPEARNPEARNPEARNPETHDPEVPNPEVSGLDPTIYSRATIPCLIGPIFACGAALLFVPDKTQCELPRVFQACLACVIGCIGYGLGLVIQVGVKETLLPKKWGLKQRRAILQLINILYMIAFSQVLAPLFGKHFDRMQQLCREYKQG